MNEKINLIKADGTTIQADLICFLEVLATGRRFVFYTLNEVMGADANATVKIYVSKVKQDNPALDASMTGDEWQLFTKTVMKSTIQGVPCNEVKYISMSELVNPVSITEKAIAMPVFHDYINKQRGLYAEAVATGNSVTQELTAPVTEPQVTATPETPVEAPQAPDTMTAQTTVDPTTAPIAAADSSSLNNTNFEVVSQAANIFDNPVAAPAPLAVEPSSEATTSATLEPQDTVPVQEVQAEDSSEDSNGSSAVLEPIDLAMIEMKYKEMIDNINKLKEQELEAAKRYNATIELSAMHKEQHANYIQNEQVKETPAQPVEPTPVVSQEPVAATVDPTPQANPNPFDASAINPTAVNPAEPTPVTPVVPEPAPVTTANLETNWFDMPNNQ